MASVMTETIKASDLRRLLEQQGYRCAYTGETLAPETASLDHMTPLTRGGSHAASNLAIVLESVNQAKGTMTLPEFVAMCRSVARYADSQGWE